MFSKSSKDSFAGFVGTGSAKKDFNYPRPYFNKENEGVDRTIGGDTDLNGLSPTLDIKRIPMINIDGQEYGEDYTDYQEPSQSFPSGHTTSTYNRGAGIGHAAPLSSDRNSWPAPPKAATTVSCSACTTRWT